MLATTISLSLSQGGAEQEWYLGEYGMSNDHLLRYLNFAYLQYLCGFIFFALIHNKVALYPSVVAQKYWPAKPPILAKNSTDLCDVRSSADPWSSGTASCSVLWLWVITAFMQWSRRWPLEILPTSKIAKTLTGNQSSEISDLQSDHRNILRWKLQKTILLAGSLISSHSWWHNTWYINGDQFTD